jgi:PPK2 family polyphosphate:nucleotide phosphotransferase
MSEKMSTHEKKFLIAPGAKVKLEDCDSDSNGKHESHKDALPEIQKHLEKMDKLQYLLYSEGRHSLLIVLQGLDGAGKDGVVRHVLTGMDPQGCTVTAFKQPTPEALAHDFLWRVHPHAPAKGQVAIFNRSHYEDVLVVRVHKLVPEEEWSKRYDLINDFERLLVTENNTTILKFFLHISKEEQLSRFKKRLEDPTHNWKISELDYREREYWKEYKEAYEDLLHKTSTEHAPWFVIPSDHKWFRNLAISKIITNQLEHLGMKPPVPTADLAEIHRKYHAAVEEAKYAKKKAAA